MRPGLHLVAAALALTSSHALAQGRGDSRVAAPTEPSRQIATRSGSGAGGGADAGEKAWSLSASIDTYIVLNDRDYVQPTITYDRDWLHLEARYNYEDLDTGSVWVGRNFSIDKPLAVEFTPMLGGVFGSASGIAPGYKGSVGWWKLELYGEGEYFFDTDEVSGSFFYNWSELTLAPVEWLYVGLVTERTRLYRSDGSIQRGPLVGLSFSKLEVTTYVVNPGGDNATVMVSVAVRH